MLTCLLAWIATATYIGIQHQDARFNPAPKAALLDARPAPRASRSEDRTLACIRNAESHDNYQARNGNHYGAYQFVPSTFDSAGGPDYDGVRPDKAPPHVQDKRARRLVQIRRAKHLDPYGKWTTARRCR